MKTLTVFYSRTGTTRKVAGMIANRLFSDVEEINDFKKRSGIIGFLRSGYEAFREKTPPIKDPKKDVSNYDLVIIGTPIWANRMASPMRTYLNRMGKLMNKVAFFCTYDGSGTERTFNGMKKFIDKEPLSKLAIKQRELKQELYKSKIDDFISELKENSR